MQETKCEGCKFWQEDEKIAKQQLQGLRLINPNAPIETPKYGNCRRFPPIFVGNGFSYPVTRHYDWCGEAVVKEADAEQEKTD